MYLFKKDFEKLWEANKIREAEADFNDDWVVGENKYTKIWARYWVYKLLQVPTNTIHACLPIEQNFQDPPLFPLQLS